MKKKDYLLIAGVIASCKRVAEHLKTKTRKGLKTDEYKYYLGFAGGIEYLEHRMISSLQAENPRFNQTEFSKTCKAWQNLEKVISTHLSK